VVVYCNSTPPPPPFFNSSRFSPSSGGPMCRRSSLLTGGGGGCGEGAKSYDGEKAWPSVNLSMLSAPRVAVNIKSASKEN
jgi:hypothetical protein